MMNLHFLVVQDRHITFHVSRLYKFTDDDNDDDNNIGGDNDNNGDYNSIQKFYCVEII